MAKDRDLPDFDTLLAIHRRDPEQLEKLRTEATNRLLETAPADVRRRLEGLQFRIDMELRRARTPEARCVRLSGMMRDAFAALHFSLHHPGEAVQRHTADDDKAKVLPLPGAQRRSR